MRTASLKNISGYTLLEMTVVIGVAGLLIAAAAAAWHVYNEQQKYQTTVSNVETAVNTLDIYLARFGRYPCPARLDAQRSDADYGMEGQCDKTMDAGTIGVLIAEGKPVPPAGAYPDPATIAPGQCAGGICMEKSKRADIGNPTVRRGALPFRILNIPEDQSVDGYGDRLQYAVTEPLAVITNDPNNTYNNGHGGISIVGADNATPMFTSPKDGAHFVVFSSGPDMKGAYNKGGVQVLPCNTIANAKDAQNCNTTADLNAIYLVAPQSPLSGPGHFDDVVRFYSSVNSPLWKMSDTQGSNITDMLDPVSGQIGIGHSPVSHTLEVAGTDNTIADINADDSMKANRLANNNGDSFDPDLLTDAASPSQVNDMTCPAGSYVTGIANSKVTCGPAALPCPQGAVVIGIDSDGNIQCSGKCPATPETICEAPFTQPVTLPQGNTGDIVTVTPVVPSSPPPGATYARSVRYECNNGTWRYWDDNGQICGPPPVCHPLPDNSHDVTMDCVWYISHANGVPGTASGSPVTRHYTDDCMHYTDSPANACTCTPGVVQTQTVNCGTGYTGTKTQQRMWNCYDAGDGYWSNWADTSSACVCNAGIETSTSSCQDGYVGSITQQRTTTCAGNVATTGSWTTTSNTCVCDSTTPQVQDVGCQTVQGPGHVGNVVQHRTFNCVTNTWNSWTNFDMSGCGAGTHSWVAAGSANPTTYSTNQGLPVVGDACAPGATGACQMVQSTGYIVYPACICN